MLCAVFSCFVSQADNTGCIPDLGTICRAGERLYADEFDRMFGRHARRTQRLAEAAARRTSTLGLVYSLSMSASFLLIVMFGALSGQ